MIENKLNQLEDLKVTYDEESKSHLRDASKWAKFLSILIFTFCGIFLLLLLVFSTQMESYSEQLLGAFGISAEVLGYIVAGVVLVILVISFIYFLLFRFARLMKTGIEADNTEIVNRSWMSLKSYFIIVAIFSIIALVVNIASLFD
jgi:uncharacterized BrkB/YihY/UPF0761 family membrane protein